MRGTAHPPEVKAAVITAILLGEDPEHIAKQQKVGRNVVYEWKRQLGVGLELVRTEKTEGESLGDLVATYLQRSLNTLAIQAEFFSDRAWLQSQNAADAAVLHGVLMDKAVRVLEALERAGEQLPPGAVVDTTAGSAN